MLITVEKRRLETKKDASGNFKYYLKHLFAYFTPVLTIADRRETERR